MNVVFEESGDFKVARIMEDIGTSLQVESVSGKRSKIKAAAVLLRFDSPLAALMPEAESAASTIDRDFLYEVCGVQEFAFDELAAEYFGRQPSPAESLAVAQTLHRAPMYFYRRGRGRYQKAPPENLKAALASIARKERETAQMQDWVAALAAGRLPDDMKSHLHSLLFKPDRNTLLVKACEAAVAETGTPLPQLFFAAGAWPQYASRPHMAPHDVHVGRFLAEYFPKGRDFPALPSCVSPVDWDSLPLAPVDAFSIDDEGTTEIDDAFSLSAPDADTWEVGIHIAAPALFFGPDDPLDALAAERLSTVYFPGDKITMLPPALIDAATLAAGRACPALSLYARFARNGFALHGTRTVVERVRIARNLRLPDVESRLTAPALAAGDVAGTHGRELAVLHGIALALRTARGAKDETDRVDYRFAIDDGRVRIEPRTRGSPVDTLVAELMIFTNQSWGAALADNGVAAIYRAQSNMKTRMTTDVLPHEGLGVPCYAWCTSPLRRYVDLVNQRQLIAWLRGDPPRFPKRSPALAELARRFDLTYDAYAEFQRTMERFWSQRWLAQEGRQHFAATILRDELARAAELPLVVRLDKNPGLPSRTAVTVGIRALNDWTADGEFFLVEPAPAGGDPA